MHLKGFLEAFQIEAFQMQQANRLDKSLYVHILLYIDALMSTAYEYI